MKTFLAGAAFLLVLILANVVAAGVFSLLGPIAADFDDGLAWVLALALVGLLAVACSLLFLRGVLFCVVERFSAVRADPKKGLQFDPGQRGG